VNFASKEIDANTKAIALFGLTLKLSNFRRKTFKASCSQKMVVKEGGTCMNSNKGQDATTIKVVVPFALLFCLVGLAALSVFSGPVYAYGYGWSPGQWVVWGLAGVVTTIGILVMIGLSLPYLRWLAQWLESVSRKGLTHLANLNVNGNTNSNEPSSSSNLLRFQTLSSIQQPPTENHRVSASFYPDARQQYIHGKQAIAKNILSAFGIRMVNSSIRTTKATLEVIAYDLRDRERQVLAALEQTMDMPVELKPMQYCYNCGIVIPSGVKDQLCLDCQTPTPKATVQPVPIIAHVTPLQVSPTPKTELPPVPIEVKTETPPVTPAILTQENTLAQPLEPEKKPSEAPITVITEHKEALTDGTVQALTTVETTPLTPKALSSSTKVPIEEPALKLEPAPTEAQPSEIVPTPTPSPAPMPAAQADSSPKTIAVSIEDFVQTCEPIPEEKDAAPSLQSEPEAEQVITREPLVLEKPTEPITNDLDDRMSTTVKTEQTVTETQPEPATEPLTKTTPTPQVVEHELFRTQKTVGHTQAKTENTSTQTSELEEGMIVTLHGYEKLGKTARIEHIHKKQRKLTITVIDEDGSYLPIPVKVNFDNVSPLIPVEEAQQQ